MTSDRPDDAPLTATIGEFKRLREAYAGRGQRIETLERALLELVEVHEARHATHTDVDCAAWQQRWYAAWAAAAALIPAKQGETDAERYTG